jgi:hypothetical protein
MAWHYNIQESGGPGFCHLAGVVIPHRGLNALVAGQGHGLPERYSLFSGFGDEAGTQGVGGELSQGLACAKGAAFDDVADGGGS